MMDTLLGRHTAMKVTVATEGVPLVGNHVFVIPPGTTFDGMPTSAIATGVVDQVLAPAELAAEVARLVDGRGTAPAGAKQIDFDGAGAEAVIDVLFTDVQLPGDLNGPDIAEAAAAGGRRLAVVLTSGYPAEAMSIDGRLGADVELLAKPYRREDLHAAFERAIAAAGRSRPFSR